MATLKEKLTSTPEGVWLYQREEMIQGLTDTVCELMKQKGVSRAELARRLRNNELWVDWMLDGGVARLLPGTITDIFTALDSRVVFTAEPL